MLWLILGAALTIGVFVLLVNWEWPVIVTAILCCAVFCSVGIAIPYNFDLGYNDRELKETFELVSLGTDITSVGSGNRSYVTVSGKKVYTYRYEVENTTELEGKMYKTTTINGNVEEIESAECQAPMLYIYVEDTKNSWWFSFNTDDRYTYVFYVPEGTIVRDVTLD